jgi:formylglycine-generating enzyme required for sulfatase activity
VVLDKSLRIYRGGSFGDLAPSLRSAYRDGSRPTTKFPQLGFRIARTIPR